MVILRHCFVFQKVGGWSKHRGWLCCVFHVVPGKPRPQIKGQLQLCKGFSWKNTELQRGFSYYCLGDVLWKLKETPVFCLTWLQEGRGEYKVEESCNRADRACTSLGRWACARSICPFRADRTGREIWRVLPVSEQHAILEVQSIVGKWWNM